MGRLIASVSVYGTHRYGYITLYVDSTRGRLPLDVVYVKSYPVRVVTLPAEVINPTTPPGGPAYKPAPLATLQGKYMRYANTTESGRD